MNTTTRRKQQQPPAEKIDTAVMEREAEERRRTGHVEHQEWRGEGVVSENHTD
jgi:hypothetical protein